MRAASRERAKWSIVNGFMFGLLMACTLASATPSTFESDLRGVLGGAAVQAALIPGIEQSTPADGAKDVSPKGPIALKFTQPIDAASLTSDHVALIGPEGAVPATLVLRNDGRSVSLVPQGDLFPRTSYTVLVKGVATAKGMPLPLTTIAFATAALGVDSSPAAKGTEASNDASTDSLSTTSPSGALANAAADAERWLPGIANRNGNWRTGRPLPSELALRRNEAMAPQSLAPGGKVRLARAAGTVVTGIVLRQSDKPLANVRVSIGKVSAQTGGNGEFTLSGVPVGQQELIVDGRNAGKDATSQYGYFVIGVKVQPGKNTDVAPIYLPKILASDWVDIPSPVQADTVVKTPLIPGMEIRIPKGTVLRDREGKLVTKIALVPMPLDRMPFPFPENAPVYASVQPGGLIVQGLTPGTTSGITVRYPNQTDLPVGSRVQFWSYNTDERGWQIYGQGQVTPDANQVAPDPGVALYESIGFMYTYDNPPPPSDAPPPDGPGDNPPDDNDPPPDDGSDDPPGDSGGGAPGCNNEGAGDPVDCKSGLFVLDRPDVRVRGTLPIRIMRTYRPGDPTVRAFGYGQNHGYAMYLRDPVLNGQQYQKYDLILPDGSFVRFNRTSPGTGYTDVVAVHNDSASDFYGAILAYEAGDYVVTKKNGTRLVFSLYGTLDAIQDRNGNQVTVSRNGGQITRLTAGGGRYLDFTYDGSNRIAQIADIAGRTWSYAYSAAGYLERVTYPDGLHEDYTYDSAGRMLTIVNRKGTTVVTNIYDSNGRVWKQTLADGATYIFHYQLDSAGKVTQTDVVDPRSSIRRVTYGPNGYKASVTYAYGTPVAQTTTYERDAASGLVAAVVDSMGRRTELQRDAQGNVTQRTQLAGTSNAVIDGYTYTAFSRLATYTDPRGKTTTLANDARGNRLSITDPLGHKKSYTYNGAGQVLTAKDGLSNTTKFGYDPTGDLRSVTDPLNRTVTNYIDSLGRPIGIIDPLGRKTLQSYDTMSRVVSMTDPMGEQTTLGYDANGNLTSVTDPNGGTTQYGYDGRNRRTSRTDALNQSEYWTYDGMGNVLTHRDRKGQGTQYQYDELDRRKLATYADASTVSANYDAGNRLVQIDDSVSGLIVRSYDGLNRLAQEQTPQGSVSYVYDAAGRRIQMMAASQLPITYDYDNANRLISLTQGGETVGFDYDAANRRTHVTLPNKVKTQTTYDDANQITEIAYSAAQGASLGSIAYTYDAAGQRLSRGQSISGMSDLLPTLTIGANVFDLNNRQVQTNGFGINYDANGDVATNNATKPIATSYIFDARHRLVEMKQAGAAIATFQYDPFGRRIRKTIGSATTTFLYDGDDPIQETQGSEVNTILTGLDVDERYARMESAGQRYFLTDALNSTVALVDVNGVIQQTYSYEPYGEAQSSGLSGNSYQYTGREYDGLGLYFYRSRYYDLSIKRFVSEDPTELAAGLNVYGYADNNPGMLFDPYGFSGTAIPIPNPNGVVPGGPWTPNPGNRPGNYLGPKPEGGGGRPQCQYVPPQGQGGPPGSNGYWKVNQPGQPGWQRYNGIGQPITPEEAHPGLRIPPVIIRMFIFCPLCPSLLQGMTPPPYPREA